MDPVTPVDGFTVEHAGGGLVVLTLSNRYGTSDQFTFNSTDAARIGHALVAHAQTG
jgi:hypothetical protein